MAIRLRKNGTEFQYKESSLKSDDLNDTFDDKFVEIQKRIFKANNGLQLQLFRQKIEVMEFETYCKENNITPNPVQQAHIDSVKTDYEYYDNAINNYLGTISLKDMIETEKVIEE